MTNDRNNGNPKDKSAASSPDTQPHSSDDELVSFQLQALEESARLQTLSDLELIREISKGEFHPDFIKLSPLRGN